jgi:argininosuccinate lyase
MYDTVDATHDCVRIATGVLSTLSINPDRMLKVRDCAVTGCVHNMQSVCVAVGR